jgi:hypothetical protein
MTTLTKPSTNRSRTEEPTVIETVELRRDSPFAHCTFGNVFSHEIACGLSRCLTERDDWSYRSEARDRVWTCHWRSENLPLAMAALLSDEVLNGLIKRMQDVFGEVLDEDFFVTANKQEPGDGSVVHNDYFENPLNHLFFFTHRLIVYNTGAAMAMGPRSFHAVSAITEGTRYSLCFSFTNADHRYHL